MTPLVGYLPPLSGSYLIMQSGQRLWVKFMSLLSRRYSSMEVHDFGSYGWLSSVLIFLQLAQMGRRRSISERIFFGGAVSPEIPYENERKCHGNHCDSREYYEPEHPAVGIGVPLYRDDGGIHGCEQLLVVIEQVLQRVRIFVPDVTCHALP